MRASGKVLKAVLITVPITAALVLLCVFGPRLYRALFHKAEAEPTVTELMDRPADEVVSVDKDSVVSVWYVKELLEPASELITLKYHYTDADVFEDYKELWGMRLPLTTNKTIFTYDGTVSVGFDFSKIKVRISYVKKIVTVTLPPAEVIANEIDASSFKYYDVANSVFNPLKMEDVTGLIGELKEKKADKVVADHELIRMANENARSILKDFLSASKLAENYHIIFKTQN